MRDFLTDISIVGAAMAFREGELIRYCLDNLLKYCDKIVVLLDNWDKETEKIVLFYAKIYSQIKVIYSTVPKLKGNIMPRDLKNRLRHNQDRIREQICQELRRMHQQQKIDLLLWPDGDEMFTDYLPELLQQFWQSDKEMLCAGVVVPYDKFNIIRETRMVPHAKIFKYKPEMTAIPYRRRAFYHPFTRDKAIKIRNTLIHLALFTEKNRKMREFYAGAFNDKNKKLWFFSKNVRKLNPIEIQREYKTSFSCTIKEYEEKFSA